MNKNEYTNSMQVYNLNIFRRIKNFFTNLFKRNIQTKNIVGKKEITPNKIKQEFIKDIKIPEEKANSRLLKMQKDFEKGLIKEEDLNDSDLNDLRKLYMQQIEEKKKSIENYKKRIIKIKAQLV